MARTVIEAFEVFLRDTINLDSGQTGVAKRSRDWLMDRIAEFPDNDATFPLLYPAKHIFFGSFERKTKKRPLDDIDIMIGLFAQGAVYDEVGETLYLSTTNTNSPLYALRDDSGKYINSRRVINKFVTALSGLHHYRKAEIGRRGEAAILSMQTYDWNFDIVPCFFTNAEWNGRQYYIIPDGNGHWKKTDPRIDRDRVRRLVALRGSKILDSIRLMKYWNNRPTMPTMPSYMLENMILDYYESNVCGNYPDWETAYLINYIQGAIFKPVTDPKGVQGDLNGLSSAEQIAISVRCLMDLPKCQAARDHEGRQEMRLALQKWREVYGSDFPLYTGS